MTQTHHSGSINARARWVDGEDAARQVTTPLVAIVGVFESAAWVGAAWRHLVELGDPRVLAVDLGPRTWWLPLAARNGELRLAGAPLGDRHDLVGPSGPGRADAAVAMRDALTHTRADVRLDALAPDGAMADVLHQDPAWIVEPEASPLIASTPALSTGARRRLRRLGRLGPTRIEVLRYPELDETVAQAFVDARRTVWRLHGREFSAVERLPGIDAFLTRAVTDLARVGRARLWQLRVADAVVAQDLHLGLLEAPLLYMRAYDPAVAALSPGKVLLEQTLFLLHRQGVPVLDAGRGDEPYKMALGGDASTVCHASLRHSHQIRR